MFFNSFQGVCCTYKVVKIERFINKKYFNFIMLEKLFRLKKIQKTRKKKIFITDRGLTAVLGGSYGFHRLLSSHPTIHDGIVKIYGSKIFRERTIEAFDFLEENDQDGYGLVVD